MPPLCQMTARTLKLLKRKPVTTLDLQRFKRENKPITMVTAYDYPSAVHVDLAGIDVVLVGDSVGMVEMGMKNTLSVTLDHMLYHCQAVARGTQRALVLMDLPFGTVEGAPFDVLRHATRALKEGHADAVKVEGGRHRAKTIQTLVEAGIGVVGHVGLTPQSISVLGGFRAQGKTSDQAAQVMEDALAVQEAGACALVVECVPSCVAQTITETLTIPTIGIGSGVFTGGQVLVYHDLLGMLSHPHHAEFVPKFSKQYADVGHAIRQGLETFRHEIETRAFPTDETSPYTMTRSEQAKWTKLVQTRYRRDGASIPNETTMHDHEPIKVY